MPTERPIAGVILAAGKGTRMKSDLPKCLHALAGLPMAEHVGRALASAGCSLIVVIIGHGGELLQAGLPEGRYTFCTQSEQLGTGHAVQMAELALRQYDGPVLIAAGDTPLLSSTELMELRTHHERAGAAVTLASCCLKDPTGYGRVMRGLDGRVTRIVEQKDANDLERSVKEVNSGVYVVESSVLFRLLPRLGANNAQGEIYLTDIVAEAARDGLRVEACLFDDPSAFAGVNDRWQLAQAATVMRERILRKWAMNGVSIEDPGTTFIDADVVIGPDTMIRAMTLLEGNTAIGAGCMVGPGTQIISGTLEDEAVVIQSVVNRATLRKGARCGPFAHLRPGTILGERAKVGNFVEVKKASLGDNVSISHLSYIGDATVGAGTNIGAGTITCNYDGIRKFTTTIGEGCFIGSNSTLVAPVQIGNGAFVAAGSVITRDVATDALALGRARQEDKEGWAARWRKQSQVEGS